MKILLTHTPEARALYYGDRALAALRDVGQVVTNPDDTPLDTPTLIEAARGCDLIVADRQTAVPAAVFEALPDLLAVMRCAMDVSTIDVAAADRAGVLVTRATAGFADSVAELAIGFMIDLGRGVTNAALAYRTRRPHPIRRGIQLSGSTLGIVGYGAIGERLGALAHAHGMRVLACDPARTIEAAGIEQVDQATLLATAQFTVCLAPAIPATRHMFDRQAFATMPRGSFFINLSRSSLVDEDALGETLEAGHLAGAALDVGSAPDQRPPPHLAERGDVIATPHIGGLTSQAVEHQAFDTVRQAAAITAGTMPPNPVNPDSATRLRASWASAEPPFRKRPL